MGEAAHLQLHPQVSVIDRQTLLPLSAPLIRASPNWCSPKVPARSSTVRASTGSALTSVTPTWSTPTRSTWAAPCSGSPVRPRAGSK